MLLINISYKGHQIQIYNVLIFKFIRKEILGQFIFSLSITFYIKEIPCTY